MNTNGNNSVLELVRAYAAEMKIMRENGNSADSLELVVDWQDDSDYASIYKERHMGKETRRIESAETKAERVANTASWRITSMADTFVYCEKVTLTYSDNAGNEKSRMAYRTALKQVTFEKVNGKGIIRVVTLKDSAVTAWNTAPISPDMNLRYVESRGLLDDNGRKLWGKAVIKAHVQERFGLSEMGKFVETLRNIVKGKAE